MKLQKSTKKRMKALGAFTFTCMCYLFHVVLLGCYFLIACLSFHESELFFIACIFLREKETIRKHKGQHELKIRPSLAFAGSKIGIFDFRFQNASILTRLDASERASERMNERSRASEQSKRAEQASEQMSAVERASRARSAEQVNE